MLGARSMIMHHNKIYLVNFNVCYLLQRIKSMSTIKVVPSGKTREYYI